MANSADPDQLASSENVKTWRSMGRVYWFTTSHLRLKKPTDLDLHCLPLIMWTEEANWSGSTLFAIN